MRAEKKKKKKALTDTSFAKLILSRFSMANLAAH